MHMHTDLKFLTVMQWMSPAFPIGAFAYSHGLEWAIDKGHVSNGKKLQNWITDLLEYGSLRTDAIFISLILRGYDACLLYTSPSPRDMRRSRMPSSA